MAAACNNLNLTPTKFWLEYLELPATANFMQRRMRTKKSQLKKLARFVCSFGLLFVSLVICQRILRLSEAKAPDKTPLAILGCVPIPEIPAQAVALVRSAPAALRVSVVTNMLWAVAGLARPGVMPYVISSLCRAYPDLADVVVGTAVEINNTPFVTIFSAAKVAAPDMISKITMGAFKARPEAFADIALAVAEHTSVSSTNILRDLSKALPNLQPFLDTARIQSDQVTAVQKDDNTTNVAARQLSVILSYTLNAITNSGQTIGEVLTNGNAGPIDFPDTNSQPSVDISTNLNNKSSLP
jgi:hypothetical protein